MSNDYVGKRRAGAVARQPGRHYRHANAQSHDSVLWMWGLLALPPLTYLLSFLPHGTILATATLLAVLMVFIVRILHHTGRHAGDDTDPPQRLALVEAVVEPEEVHDVPVPALTLVSSQDIVSWPNRWEGFLLLMYGARCVIDSARTSVETDRSLDPVEEPRALREMAGVA